MDRRQILGLYLIAVNFLAFALMGIDKGRARRHGRRISERALFFFPLMGGALGGIAGMGLFRHKTLHRSFRLGLPALLALQAAALVWALGRI